jgi:acetyl esterase
MSEHSQVLSYARRLEKAGLGGNKMATIDSSRERLRHVVKVMARPSAKLAEITETRIKGPDGPIRVRIYKPKKEGPKSGSAPLVVFFHGGGWIVGDLDLSDEALRLLSGLSGATIVSVEYRLAPEHPFPAGLEDCYAATVWAVENTKALGVDPRKLVVCGESAGGNLAAATTLLAKKRKGPKIAYQILIYPPLDLVRDQSTYTDTEVGRLTMAAKEMLWMRDNYLQDDKHEGIKNPLVSPIMGDLKGLPTALMFTAENDPLTEQDRDYARKLRKAGVRVRLVNYPGAIHGFWNFPSHFDSGDDAVRKAARVVKAL